MTKKFLDLHHRIHIQECFNQAVQAEVPVISTLNILLGAAFLKPALISGVGLTVSCYLGKVTDEFLHESQYNNIAFVTARCFGGYFKYGMKGSSSVLGCINNGLYGVASKTLEGDSLAEMLSPIAIEGAESVLETLFIVGAVSAYKTIGTGLLAGVMVAGIFQFYEPTEGAKAFSMALKDDQCHTDCDLASSISYNNVEFCPNTSKIAGQSNDGDEL